MEKKPRRRGGKRDGTKSMIVDFDLKNQRKVVKKRMALIFLFHGNDDDEASSVEFALEIDRSMDKLKMIMNPTLLIPLLIIIIANGCDGWVFDLPRKLTSQKLTKSRHESAESAPIPAPTESNLDNYYIETEERCSISTTERSCRDLSNNISACLLSSNTSTRELFLLVQNDGEGLLRVNFTISDIKVTFPEMPLPKHHAKKINISEKVEGSPSIILNAGNGSCIIDLGSQEPKGKYKPLFFYGTHLSPIYGAYLLFLIALIAGGAWACCRLLKSERHVDGVPYQELEMGQSDSHSANNVETAEGWEESWDDGWDEIKEVKPPNGHQTANALPNGITSRSSDANGRRKNWND